MARTFRFRRPDGGSALRGGDGLRAPDKNVYEYPAAGGIEYGGAADTQFVSAAKPATDHGGGGYFPSRTIGIPIRRRQYGHGVTHEYRGDGGITFGGAAVVEFVPGRNKQKQENENAAFLLMAA